MFFFGVFFCNLILALPTPILISKPSKESAWTTYKKEYGINLTSIEDERRSVIFLKNLQYILEHNKKNNDFQLGLNKFAHLEKHEMPRSLKIRRPARSTETPISTGKLPEPQQVDWRDFGVVSPVKDQGNCGSCYAFSAIGACESAFALRRGKIVLLSEQQIVDCSLDEGNYGCNGGYMENVFKYGMEHDLLPSEDYTYHAKRGACHIPKVNLTEKHGLLSFVDVTPYSEDDLVRAVAFVGPVSIAIDADHSEFSFYKSGIMRIDNCSQTELDHGVLAVGYQLGDEPYLLVKNSWGSDWGMEGYFKIALFSDNMCGIATDASYPIPKITSE